MNFTQKKSYMKIKTFFSSLNYYLFLEFYN